MNEFNDGIELVHIDKEQKNMTIRLDNIRELHNKYCEQNKIINKAIEYIKNIPLEPIKFHHIRDIYAILKGGSNE